MESVNGLAGPSPAYLIAGIMLLALVLYAVLGGADYGGGVWDLLACGPRAQAQRKVIEGAIGPVWESNHVWLIYILVALFTAFPRVYSALVTALHVPFTVLLIGIVLRGAAFTFRHYDTPDEQVQRRWSLLFGLASVLTPVFLGVCIGAIMTGEIRVEGGTVVSGFVRPWLGLFPFLVGLFALGAFAFVAAVYLTLEARDLEVREDFRWRALGAGVGVGLLAWSVFVFSRWEAPLIHAGLSGRPWAGPFHLVTGTVALGALAALWMRRYGLARGLAVAQVGLIFLGWGLAQAPYVLPPNFSVEAAAAPPATLWLFLGVTGLGSLVLIPSLVYLFRIFKRSSQAGVRPRRTLTRIVDPI